ncbi:MAG: N-acetylmuramoyl-L-alanine amidase [Candidatus Niyogibacteria bacterium]|nr:N-acetylmuramoyl-L-alanine amidase [Candidatus Niyogibacteria bacterium]
MSKRAIIVGVAALVVAAFVLDVTGSLDRYLALVFPPSALSPAYLKGKYNQGQPIRLLIVPGHEVAVGGAFYRDFWERDLNIELSEKLAKLFRSDPRFEVFVTQDRSGYLPEFAEYFENNRVSIRTFYDRLRSVMRSLVSSGVVQKKTDGVHHNTAKPELGMRLYGVNKWARDNAIDIVLHLHFNDYPGRPWNGPGKYEGFAIYIPEWQLPNFEASHDIARSILRELARYFPISNYPPESAGVVEDQDLIAVGANASLEAAGILIEYGYIYEPQFANTKLRSAALSESAQQTYNGLARYFEGMTAPARGTATLPHVWTQEIAEGTKNQPDIFALQIALSRDGLYPPAGKSRDDCPPSGNFGPCTRNALRAFQAYHSLRSTGKLDFDTILKLNQLYAL